jgi:hypothetical protein
VFTLRIYNTQIYQQGEKYCKWPSVFLTAANTSECIINPDQKKINKQINKNNIKTAYILILSS